MSHYDSIIIGAGHNGLVCAAYLAKGGHRVLVLEAAGTPGGLAARREFHPGFNVHVAHTISRFSSKVARDLNLDRYGFDAPSVSMPLVGLSAAGNVAVHNGEAVGVSQQDAESYRRYEAMLRRFADMLAPSWQQTMPRIGNNSLGEILTFAKTGLRLRRLGKADMGEFLRIASLPMRDLVAEFFDDEALKALLCWDGLIGSKMAPRSPNGAVLALLYRMSETTRGAHVLPTKGLSSLVIALQRSAESAGAEIRCGAVADRIAIDGGTDGLSATGVHLASGEFVSADRVISALDAKRTFFKLVGVEYLDIGFTNRIRRIRSDGLVGKLHVALAGAPEFRGLEDLSSRMIVAPEMDAIEFAFDDAKYGNFPENPVLELVIPSAKDDSLAPAGKHVLSAHVMYVPYGLKGGWDTAARNRIADQVIETLARFAPRIRDQIIHTEFLTPADIEQQYRVSGGHWHHGDFAMDQMLMMRPTYGVAQYRSPIPGLYLCSAACHPGGDITGLPGHNAAQEILR